MEIVDTSMGKPYLRVDFEERTEGLRCDPGSGFPGQVGSRKACPKWIANGSWALSVSISNETYLNDLKRRYMSFLAANICYWHILAFEFIKDFDSRVTIVKPC